MHSFLGWRRFVPVAAFAVLLSSRGARAEDDVKAACAAAYEQAQVHQAAGRLKEAKSTLAGCLQEACPAFIQADCGQWLSDVDRALPTVVLAAKNARGEDVVAVRVQLDGALLTEVLDDNEIAMDPGTHVFRFEMEGAAPVEQRVLIRKGEKYRMLEVRFAPLAAPKPIEDVAGPEPQRDAPGPLRPYAYIAGGLGAAGIIGFAVLAPLAKSREHHLASTCSPTCSASDVDSLQTEYTLANASLALGVVGLGTGVAFFFLSQPKHTEAALGRGWDVHVGATRGGAFTSLSGRF
jgi:hypothetical protein